MRELESLSLLTYESIDDSVLLLRVEDRQGRNTFSDQLANELRHCRQVVNASRRIKAVVLTGYDSYFLTGGSKDELIKLHEGKLVFTDMDVYRFAIDCDMPVIAAMQGHAIGGGLVTGLFCDFQILSQESVYTFNFMKYGFTPGMGATYIAREKLGTSLATEMLMSARRYRGEQLRARGVGFEIVPRSQVLQQALTLASELAAMPLASLRHLKAHLNRQLHEELPGTIEYELAMHELTIHEPDVKARIASLF